MLRRSNKKTGKRRSRLRLWLIASFVVLALLAAGTILGIRQAYQHNLRPVSASQQGRVVTIPSGSSVHEIAVLLRQAGVIRATWAFEWYIRNNALRDDLQAGSYNLRPNQSVAEIANQLTQGKIATNLFTILPAQRLDQIKSALLKAGFAATDVELALDPTLYTDHPALVDKPRDASLEGYLYPESFQITTTTKPETIIRASLDEMHKRLTPELRAGIVRQSLTVHQGVILASIIEQEVSKASDKPVVAQVFLRRLREDRPLESDPTAIYGAILAGEPPSLRYESPYNTYLHKGLIPTPISNVGGASLQAVANPAGSDYLFFVAGDDGVTYFSRTAEEHESLTRQHCKTLCNNP
jgi:UPF0755 protein